MNYPVKIIFSKSSCQTSNHDNSSDPKIFLNNLFPAPLVKEVCGSLSEFFNIDTTSSADSPEMVFVLLKGSSTPFLYPSDLVFINTNLLVDFRKNDLPNNTLLPEKDSQPNKNESMESDINIENPKNEQTNQHNESFKYSVANDLVKNRTSEKLPSLFEITNTLSDIKNEVKLVSDSISNSIPSMFNLIDDNKPLKAEQVTDSLVKNRFNSDLYNEFIGLSKKSSASETSSKDIKFLHNLNEIDKVSESEISSNIIGKKHSLDQSPENSKSKQSSTSQSNRKSTKKKLKTEISLVSESSKKSQQYKDKKNTSSQDHHADSSLHDSNSLDIPSTTIKNEPLGHATNGLLISNPGAEVDSLIGNKLDSFSDFGLDIGFKMDIEPRNHNISLNLASKSSNLKDSGMFGLDSFDMGLNDADFSFFDNPSTSTFGSIVPEPIQIKPLEPSKSDLLLRANSSLFSVPTSASQNIPSNNYLIDSLPSQSFSTPLGYTMPESLIAKKNNDSFSKTEPPSLSLLEKTQPDLNSDDDLFNDFFNTNSDEEIELKPFEHPPESLNLNTPNFISEEQITHTWTPGTAENTNDESIENNADFKGESVNEKKLSLDPIKSSDSKLINSDVNDLVSEVQDSPKCIKTEISYSPTEHPVLNEVINDSENLDLFEEAHDTVPLTNLTSLDQNEACFSNQSIEGSIFLQTNSGSSNDLDGTTSKTTGTDIIKLDDNSIGTPHAPECRVQSKNLSFIPSKYKPVELGSLSCNTKNKIPFSFTNIDEQIEENNSHEGFFNLDACANDYNDDSNKTAKPITSNSSFNYNYNFLSIYTPNRLYHSHESNKSIQDIDNSNKFCNPSSYGQNSKVSEKVEYTNTYSSYSSDTLINDSLSKNSLSFNICYKTMPLNWILRMGKRKGFRKIKQQKVISGFINKNMKYSFNNYFFWTQYQSLISNYRDLPTKLLSDNPTQKISKYFLNKKNPIKSTNSNSYHFYTNELLSKTFPQNTNMFDLHDYRDNKSEIRSTVKPNTQNLKEFSVNGFSLIEIIKNTQNLPIFIRDFKSIQNDYMTKFSNSDCELNLKLSIMMQLESQLFKPPAMIINDSGQNIESFKDTLSHKSDTDENPPNMVDTQCSEGIIPIEAQSKSEMFLDEVIGQLAHSSCSAYQSETLQLYNNDQLSRVASIIAEWATFGIASKFINKKINLIQKRKSNLGFDPSNFSYFSEYILSIFGNKFFFDSTFSYINNDPLALNSPVNVFDNIEQNSKIEANDFSLSNQLNLLQVSSLAFIGAAKKDNITSSDFSRVKKSTELSIFDSFISTKKNNELEFNYSSKLSNFSQQAYPHQIIVGLYKDTFHDNKSITNSTNSPLTSINCNLSSSNAFNLQIYCDYLNSPSNFRSFKHNYLINDSLISNFEYFFGQKNYFLNDTYNINIEKTLEDVFHLTNYPKFDDCILCSGRLFYNHYLNNSPTSYQIEFDDKNIPLSKTLTVSNTTSEPGFIAEDAEFKNDAGMSEEFESKLNGDLSESVAININSLDQAGQFDSSSKLIINNFTNPKNISERSLLDLNSLSSDSVEEGEEIECDEESSSVIAELSAAESNKNEINNGVNPIIDNLSSTYDIGLPDKSDLPDSLRSSDKEFSFVPTESINNYNDSEFFNLIDPENSSALIELSNMNSYYNRQFVVSTGLESLCLWESLPLIPIGGSKSTYYFSVSNFKSTQFIQRHLENSSFIYSHMRFGRHTPLNISKLFSLYYWQASLSDKNTKCALCDSTNCVASPTEDNSMFYSNHDNGENFLHTSKSRLNEQDCNSSISISSGISNIEEMVALSKSIGSIVSDSVCAIYTNALELDDSYNSLNSKFHLSLPQTLIKKVLAYLYNMNIAIASTNNITIYITDDIIDQGIENRPVYMSIFSEFVNFYYSESWNKTQFKNYFPKFQLLFEFIESDKELFLLDNFDQSYQLTAPPFSSLDPELNATKPPDCVKSYKYGVSQCWKLYDRLPSCFTNFYSSSIVTNQKLNLEPLDLKKILIAHEKSTSYKKPAIFLSSLFNIPNSHNFLSSSTETSSEISRASKRLENSDISILSYPSPTGGSLAEMGFIG
ncbi:hypothetical protein AYI70_g5349, partial [Smittium culicis]